MPSNNQDESYRQIFNALNDPVFVHDAATGAILDVNDTLVEQYGYTRDELKRLTLDDLSAGVPPFDHAHALRKINAAMETGLQVFEWKAKKKSGELVWVEVALTCAQVAGKQRILAVVRGIRERKETEKALRLDESRLEALLKLNQMTEASIADITYFSLEEAIRLPSAASWISRNNQITDGGPQLMQDQGLMAITPRSLYDLGRLYNLK